MSKILELLNYDREKEGSKRDTEANRTGRSPVEDFNTDTKEKLASTYIFNSAGKQIRPREKPYEDIPAPKYNIAGAPRKSVSFFPWLIAILATLLLLVNIAYRGKVSIKIEFLKEGPMITGSPITKEALLKSDLSLPTGKGGPAEQGGIAPVTIALITENGLNRDAIKKFGFYGAALNNSRMIRDGFILFNDGSTGYASAGFDFARPMDLSGSTLDFFIKGAEGNESLKLFLRDADSKSYAPQADKNIFSGNLSDEWQFVSVPFGNFEGTYNQRRIIHIGFEFGTQTTSNKPGASVYIKNMNIVKTAAGD